MEKIKVGIIGAGARAQTHYSSLAEMDDVNIDSICDLNEERLKFTAERYHIKRRFTDYNQMLEKADLDALYIIMQPNYLDPIVTRCLERGKNVFIEKPPGMTAEQTKKWADLAQKRSCKTMVGFQRRFHPISVEARRIVEERSKILYCMASFHKHQLLSPPHEWMEMMRRGDEANRGPFSQPSSYSSMRVGNQLLEDVIHAVDMLVWMGGGVKKVNALFGQLFAEPVYYDPLHVNFWTAALEFETGGVGLLNCNRTAGGRALYFEMHGKGISAYGNIPGLRDIDSCLIQKDDIPYEKAEIIRGEQLVGKDAPETHVDGSFQLNRHFMDCIKGDNIPTVNFGEAIKTMEVIDEIFMGRRLPPVFES
jgi:predicted dehydrogenase